MMGPLGEEGHREDELVEDVLICMLFFALHLHAFHVLSRVQPREIPRWATLSLPAF